MSTIQPDTNATPVGTVEITPELAQARRSQLSLIAERFFRNKVAVAGLVMLIVIALLAIFAPIITHASATFDPPNTQDLNAILQGPSAQHLLGTDDLGRDELARLLFGAQVSLTIGIVSMLVAIVIGVTIGAVAGYYGGWIDTLMMRVTDGFLATPLYLVLFVLSVAFSNGSESSIIVLIGALSWASTARIVRGEFLALKEREFLLAARTLGAGDARLMLIHILPNAVGPIMVAVTLLVGNNIITESVLSFFGFGLHPPLASWGTLLAESEQYLVTNPLLLYAPLAAIVLTVLSFNLIGDGLRDALDPYMTQR